MRVASYWSAASGWRAGVLHSEVGRDGTADVVDCADAIAASGIAETAVTVRELLASSALDEQLACAVRPRPRLAK